MALATTSTGALNISVSDPTLASNVASVSAYQLSDSQALTAMYALLVGNVPLLLTPGSTFSRQLAAVGAPGVPAINTEGTKATASAAVIAFTPAATATDFWQIVWVSKTIRVTRISISGTATSAATVDIQLIKRTVANTGGTVAAVTAAKHDSNNGTITAVVNTYSVNASPLGAGANVRGQKLNLGAAGAAGTIVWDFTTRNGQGIVLRASGESLNLNWNGAAVPSGTVLDIDAEWTEE